MYRCRINIKELTDSFVASADSKAMPNDVSDSSGLVVRCSEAAGTCTMMCPEKGYLFFFFLIIKTKKELQLKEVEQKQENKTVH